MIARFGFADRVGRRLLVVAALFWAPTTWGADSPTDSSSARAAAEKIGIGRGICAVLGLPDGAERASSSTWPLPVKCWFTSSRPTPTRSRPFGKAAEAAGLLGSRVFVDQGAWDRVHLADNLAGAVLVSAAAADAVGDAGNAPRAASARQGGRRRPGNRQAGPGRDRRVEPSLPRSGQQSAVDRPVGSRTRT